MGSRGTDYGEKRGGYRGNAGSPPFGVQIIVILGGFFTILGMLGSFAIVGAGGAFVLLGVILFVVGIGQLLAYYGLYIMESWGWTWTLIFQTLGLILGVLSIDGAADVIGLFISVIVIVYVYSLRDLYR